MRNDELSCFRSHLTRRASSYQLLEQPLGRRWEKDVRVCINRAFIPREIFSTSFGGLLRFAYLSSDSSLASKERERFTEKNNSFHGYKQSHSLTSKAEKFSN